MKAGTTTLFDHLAGHPAVAASRDKEPKYFARDNVYAQGPDWYASLWDWDPADPLRSRWRRRPTTRSATSTPRPRRGWPPTPASSGSSTSCGSRSPASSRTTTTPSRRAGRWPTGRSARTCDPDLVEPCRYAWQLDAFTDQFPRSSILVLAFEDLVADPEGTVDRVLDHWDLPAEGFSIDSGPGAELVEHARSCRPASHTARKLPGSAWLANRVSPTVPPDASSRSSGRASRHPASTRRPGHARSGPSWPTTTAGWPTSGASTWVAWQAAD